MKDNAAQQWRSFLEQAEPTDRVTSGNRLTHLRDDDRAVQATWRRIDAAQERVWMSMYIVAPDHVGLGTIERLTEAARRGCEVCLIYDFLGSIRLRSAHLEPLARAGGRFAAFNRFWPPWDRTGSLRIRNHRKLIIVDTEAALCGGLNMSDEYCSRFGDEWVFDDTVVMIEGPSVLDLMEVFQRTWHEVTGDHVDLPARPAPIPDGCEVQVLETDPRRPTTQLRSMVDAAIMRASERCYLATPYFIPADWLVRSLVAAADRGVDVRIMTAGRTDLPPARGAARRAYGPLLEAGVEIFEMFGRVLHSKIVMIDGLFGTIGSYNFDRWTARHALDTSVAFVGADLASSLEMEFDRFSRETSPFTLHEYRRRGVPTRAMHWLSAKLVDIV